MVDDQDASPDRRSRPRTRSRRLPLRDGLSGGHAISLSPDERLGFLGNTGQHLAFYDTARPEETERVSTLRFEPTDSSIKGSTHAVWLDATTGITAVGESFWQFDVNALTSAENIGAHGLKLPHAIKRTASGRHLVYGGMDHPRRGEACEVGIFDLERRAHRVVELPVTSPPTSTPTCACPTASSSTAPVAATPSS